MIQKYKILAIVLACIYCPAADALVSDQDAQRAADLITLGLWKKAIEAVSLRGVDKTGAARVLSGTGPSGGLIDKAYAACKSDKNSENCTESVKGAMARAAPLIEIGKKAGVNPTAPGDYEKFIKAVEDAKQVAVAPTPVQKKPGSLGDKIKSGFSNVGANLKKAQVSVLGTGKGLVNRLRGRSQR